jgi:hypothetical protein
MRWGERLARVFGAGDSRGVRRLTAQLVDLRAQHIDTGYASDTFLRLRRGEQLGLIGPVALGEPHGDALLHDVVPGRSDVGGELLFGAPEIVARRFDLALCFLRLNLQQRAVVDVPGGADLGRCSARTPDSSSNRTARRRPDRPGCS